ncbi:MAG: hypothetical protein ACI9OJ_001920, partial [Myxococcota bacterium]
MQRLIGLVFICAAAGCAGTGNESETGTAETGGEVAVPLDGETVLDAPDVHSAADSDAETGFDVDCPGGFGCACDSEFDCTSGHCLEDEDTGDGTICTAVCDDDCPAGYTCDVLVESCPQCLNLCFPIPTHACEPCASDATCAPGVCLDVTDGMACADLCSDALPCPDGYDCVAVDDAGVSACRPTNGSCDCTADNDGAARPCTIANDAGSCDGVETCSITTGWTTCNASVPSIEVCNGIDDDCDGKTDEAIADIGVVCGNIVSGVGACPGVFACAGAGGLYCNGPTPIADVCNGLDDDCNGIIDDGFLADGLYSQDEHCGVCGAACADALPEATGACAIVDEAPVCVIDSCDAGLAPISNIECVPVALGLCDSCSSDADCQSWQTCTDIGAGTFCSFTCSEDAPCPEGFACSDGSCTLESGGCAFQGKECAAEWECDDLSAC